MNFVKSTVVTFLTNVLIFGISILTAALTARLLGTEGSGILSVANNTIGTSLIILGFGIASSNIFFIGRDNRDVESILGINLLITFVSVTAVILLYFLNLRFNFGFLKGLDNKIIITALLSIPIFNLKRLFLNILLGLQKIIIYNKINLMDRIVSFCLLAVFLFIFKSPYWAVISNLIAAVIILTGLSYLIFYKYGYKISFKLSIFKEMFKYGIKAQIGNVIQNLNYRLDIFIMNYYLPISQVGIYSKAVQLGETMWKVSGSIATVIYPMTTNSKNKLDMKKFINQVTRISFFIILLCSIFIVLISKPLIVILLGKDFLPAVEALILLIPGISIFSISNIISNYLSGIGKVEKNIIASGAACVVTIVLDLILIPRIGIKGAAIASSSAYITSTLIVLAFYTKITESKLKDIIILKREDIILIKDNVNKRLNKFKK